MISSQEWMNRWIRLSLVPFEFSVSRTGKPISCLPRLALPVPGDQIVRKGAKNTGTTPIVASEKEQEDWGEGALSPNSSPSLLFSCHISLAVLHAIVLFSPFPTIRTPGTGNGSQGLRSFCYVACPLDYPAVKAMFAVCKSIDNEYHHPAYSVIWGSCQWRHAFFTSYWCFFDALCSCRKTITTINKGSSYNKCTRRVPTMFSGRRLNKEKIYWP